MTIIARESWFSELSFATFRVSKYEKFKKREKKIKKFYQLAPPSPTARCYYETPPSLIKKIIVGSSFSAHI